MPKGEKILSPKQKDRTTMPISKKIQNKVLMFSISIFQIGIPLKKFYLFLYLYFKEFFKIWYLKYLTFSQFVKPSWTLREEFHPGGVLFSQRKSIWNRGRKFQILKMLLEILFIYLWLFANRLWKDFPKEIAKTKQVVQAWSKMLK